MSTPEQKPQRPLSRDLNAASSPRHQEEKRQSVPELFEKGREAARAFERCRLDKEPLLEIPDKGQGSNPAEERAGVVLVNEKGEEFIDESTGQPITVTSQRHFCSLVDKEGKPGPIKKFMIQNLRVREIFRSLPHE